MNFIDSGILVAIFLAIIGQSTILWRRFGNLESNLVEVRDEQKRVADQLKERAPKLCPFPECPVFHKAIESVENKE